MFYLVSATEKNTLTKKYLLILLVKINIHHINLYLLISYVTIIIFSFNKIE